MNGLDICAGSGIGSAVWRALGGRTVCYVERDAYCQQLLQARMRDGVICDAPVWDDLKTFDGRPWRGHVDFMWGGIPCQPYSDAGKQQGEADERDLWPDFRRVLCEVRPRFALVENVSGFLAAGGGLARVLGELAESGYDAEWDCIPACSVGAPHQRDRAWIIAYTAGADVAPQSEDTRRRAQTQLGGSACGTYWGEWLRPSPVCRVDDGIPDELDELIAVAGNGWVPQVAVIPMGRVAQLLGGLQHPPGGV